MKRKLFSTMLALAALGMVPGGLSAYNPYYNNSSCCLDNIHIGADFLYWQPCVSDNDWAIEADEPIGENVISNDLETKYHDCEWEPGFRVWVKVDDIFCGFNGAVIYTYFDHSTKDSTDGDLNTILLSRGLPFDDDPEDNFGAGNDAESKWDLEYQTLDLVLSYPLQISCNTCFGFEAFSGVKWLKFTQKREDELIDDSALVETDFEQEVDFWGIGPVMGVKSYYDWGCFKVFGMASTSLIIGQNKGEDHLEISSFDLEGELLAERDFENHDDCVCFPGFHFLSGIAYETCWCDMQFSIHVGWEYVHWVNAPSFIYYEHADAGIHSANSEKNLTLQGVFAGIDIRF